MVHEAGEKVASGGVERGNHYLNKLDENIGQSKEKDIKLKKKSGGFWKHFGVHWKTLKHKFKEVSKEVLQDSDSVKSFFEEEDSEDLLDKVLRAERGYMSPEERFLKELKKHKSLQGLVESHKSEMSGGLLNEVDLQEKAHVNLLDYIRHSNIKSDEDILHILSMDETPFKDIDLCEIREELDRRIDEEIETAGEEHMDIPSESNIKYNTNIGEALWEYRRKKWLKSSVYTVEEIRTRRNKLFIQSLPKDAYARIYYNLVNKGKSLKANKRLNLRDIVQIINAGWTEESKWERAAKGMP